MSGHTRNTSKTSEALEELRDMPRELDKRVVEKAIARRGRAHAFESINPKRTALVVIDVTTGAIALDPPAQSIVAPINELADRLRRSGGVVCWVTPRSQRDPSERDIAVFGEHQARLYCDIAQPGDPRSLLHPALCPDRRDIHATKAGFSAFFPGRCDLQEQLLPLAIEMILIAGVVTNVCCESSARDAVELGYRVIMASDANAGHSHGLHEASLNTFFRSFGDVRSVKDIIALIERGL